jgi:hypothetical protein
MHPDRGHGLVIKIEANDARNKPFIVQYDNGEIHHYSIESVNKLRMVTLALKIDVVAAVEPSDAPAWKPPPTAPRVGRRPKRSSIEANEAQLDAQGNIRNPSNVSVSREAAGWFEIVAREADQLRLATRDSELLVPVKQLSTLQAHFPSIPEQKILRALVLSNGHAGRAHLALKQSCAGVRLSLSAGEINALREVSLSRCRLSLPSGLCWGSGQAAGLTSGLVCRSLQ